MVKQRTASCRKVPTRRTRAVRQSRQVRSVTVRRDGSKTISYFKPTRKAR